MRLNKALQEKMMDVRLRDKLLAEGKISPAQVAEYQKGEEESKFAYVEEEDQEEAE
jgi:hypothetical protein